MTQSPFNRRSIFVLPMLKPHPKALLVGGKRVRGDVFAPTVGYYDKLREDVRRLSTVKPVEKIALEPCIAGYRGVLVSEGMPWLFVMDSKGFLAQPVDDNDDKVWAYCQHLMDEEAKLTAERAAAVSDAAQDLINQTYAVPSLGASPTAVMPPGTEKEQRLHGPAVDQGVERTPMGYRLTIEPTVMPDQSVAAGGVIISPKGRIALVKPTGAYGGYDYTWPKGLLEDSEREAFEEGGVEAAALREVYEETGLRCEIVRGLGHVYYDDGGTCYFYLMRPLTMGAEPDGEEVEKVHWVTHGRAMELLNNKHDITVLNRAFTKFIVKAERAKPYGHTAYTRRDPRSGKMVQVKQRGVKPQEQQAPPESSLDDVYHPPHPQAEGYEQSQMRMRAEAERRQRTAGKQAEQYQGEITPARQEQLDAERERKAKEQANVKEEYLKRQKKMAFVVPKDESEKHLDKYKYLRDQHREYTKRADKNRDQMTKMRDLKARGVDVGDYDATMDELLGHHDRNRDAAKTYEMQASDHFKEHVEPHSRKLDGQLVTAVLESDDPRNDKKVQKLLDKYMPFVEAEEGDAAPSREDILADLLHDVEETQTLTEQDMRAMWDRDARSQWTFTSKESLARDTSWLTKDKPLDDRYLSSIRGAPTAEQLENFFTRNGELDITVPSMQAFVAGFSSAKNNIAAVPVSIDSDDEELTMNFHLYHIPDDADWTTMSDEDIQSKHDKVGTLTRRFSYDDDELSVEHAYFQLEGNMQGKGVSHDLLWQSEQLYDALMVDRVTVTANLDVGGYTWAKFGFEFADDYEAEEMKNTFLSWAMEETGWDEFGYENDWGEYGYPPEERWDGDTLEAIEEQQSDLGERISDLREKLDELKALPDDHEEEDTADTKEDLVQEAEENLQEAQDEYERLERHYDETAEEWNKFEQAWNDFSELKEEIAYMSQPWEFASFTHNGDHVGKKLMLGTSWEGVRHRREGGDGQRLFDEYTESKRGKLKKAEDGDEEDKHGPDEHFLAIARKLGFHRDGMLPQSYFKKVRKADDNDLLKAETVEKGVMVALFLPKDVAKRVSIDGGEDASNMHVTLAYLGKNLTKKQRRSAYEVVTKLARVNTPLDVKLGGVGRFSASESSDGKDVVYLSVDSNDLTKFRTLLADHLVAAGVPPDTTHGFVPHVTLKYIPKGSESPVKRFEPVNVRFTKLSLAAGEKHKHAAFARPVAQLKKSAKGPGSRGGKFYYDKKGKVRYGTPPSGANLHAKQDTLHEMVDRGDLHVSSRGHVKTKADVNKVKPKRAYPGAYTVEAAGKHWIIDRYATGEAGREWAIFELESSDPHGNREWVNTVGSKAAAVEQLQDVHDEWLDKKVKKALPRKEPEKNSPANPYTPLKAGAKKAGIGGQTRYSYPGEKGGDKPTNGADKSKPEPKVGVPTNQPQPKGEEPGQEHPQSPVRVHDPDEMKGELPANKPVKHSVELQPLLDQLQTTREILQRVAERFRDGDAKMKGREGFVQFMQTHLRGFTDKHKLDDDYYGLVYDVLTERIPEATPPPEKPGTAQQPQANVS